VDGLATVEKYVQKASKAIAIGASAIFLNKPKEPSKNAAMTPEQRRDNHATLAPQIRGLNADPEKLIDHLDKNTAALSKFAPDIASGLQGTMNRASQFLQQKLPVAPPPKPLGPKYKTSDTELLKWHKYYSAVEDPTAVLHQVAAGNASIESVEALQAVYPKMYQDMQAAVTEKMTSAIANETPIPYRTKMALSLFLGSDMVPSLDSQSMLANQNMLATATQAKAQQEQSQMSGAKGKNLGKLNKSENMLTSMQATSQRKAT
jgi:hypothetical protein